MIWNLKDLDYNIEEKHFKMDTFLSAVNLVKQNCYMASVDLRDAYYTIPISIKYRKYLRFEWQGKLCQYTCLPNGLSSAPRFFTNILKPVYSSLHSKGHVDVGYVDDSYLQGDTYKECKHNVQRESFWKIGFSASSWKVSLWTHSNNNISRVCDKLSHHDNYNPYPWKGSQSQHGIGLLVAGLPAVQYGQLHYRHLKLAKNVVLEIAKGSYQDIKCLTPAAKADLGWWVYNVLQSNNPISHGKIDFEITCNASKKGWGALYNKIST